MHTEIKLGSRVRLTARAARGSRFKTRTGVVRGRTRGNGYYVLLDGNKTTSRLHRSYLEIDDRRPAAEIFPVNELIDTNAHRALGDATRPQ